MCLPKTSHLTSPAPASCYLILSESLFHTGSGNTKFRRYVFWLNIHPLAPKETAGPAPLPFLLLFLHFLRPRPLWNKGPLLLQLNNPQCSVPRQRGGASHFQRHRLGWDRWGRAAEMSPASPRAGLYGGWDSGDTCLLRFPSRFYEFGVASVWTSLS